MKMPKITHTILASLGLASTSPRTPRRAAEDARSTDRVVSQDGDAPPRPPRAGILGWLSGRAAPAPTAPEGLSVKHALHTLREGGHLPSVVSGSPYKHVKSLLEAVPASERATVVAAARFLLPPKVDAAVYDTVVAYLLTLPTETRAPVARSAGMLAPTLQLDGMHEAHAYVTLLQTLGALPEQQRLAMATACRKMQPFWQVDVPSEDWIRLLGALAGVSASELPDVARDVRMLYACATDTPTASAAFVDCVAQHTSLDAASRAVLKQQARKTDMGELDAQREGRTSKAERLQVLLAQPSDKRAAVARACNAIFANVPAERRSERAYVAAALLNASAADSAQLTDIYRELRSLGVHLSPWIVDEAQQPVARPLRDADERRAILGAWTQAFSDVPMNQRHDWLVIRTLAQLPAEERADAAMLARALSDRGSLTRDMAQREILAATPQQRQAHAARLRGPASNRPAAREGGAMDLENVMQGALQRHVEGAIAALGRRFPAPTPTLRALRDIDLHLRQLRKDCQTQPDHVLMRVRGGDTEINNALRTLNAEKAEGDFSDSVRKTPDMARLCALVWHATSAERPGVDAEQAALDRNLMRHGLVMALARCIEDDGHRVCGVGQRQYTLDCLKGFYAEAGDAQQSVTPRSLVTVLTEDFYKSHQEATPSIAQVQAFEARAQRVAVERFGDGTPEMRDFTEQFATYMRMTYAAP